jgi:hypothetical protein
MLVDSSNTAARWTVTGAIRQAAQATGTSFNYLLATAQVESGLNPRAGAPTSSARGLFQFIEQTWFATIKQAGAALGFGRFADAISKTASGHYEVRNPAMRSEILKLRSDPTANAVMAGAFTKSNAETLSERLGRAPSEGELYIAHFLGAGGAGRLVQLAASNPNAKAAQFFSHAAQANPSIFYDRTTGAARSVAQVRNILTARYDVARGSQAQNQPAVAALSPSLAPVSPVLAAPAAPRAAARAPDTAGITNAFASATAHQAAVETEVFRSLFADPTRRAPLAPVVSALWGVPGATPGANAPPTRKAASGGLLDLFRDPPAESS